MTCPRNQEVTMTAVTNTDYKSYGKPGPNLRKDHLPENRLILVKKKNKQTCKK